jgi:hypothetical protein
LPVPLALLLELLLVPLVLLLALLVLFLLRAFRRAHVLQPLAHSRRQLQLLLLALRQLVLPLHLL